MAQRKPKPPMGPRAIETRLNTIAVSLRGAADLLATRKTWPGYLAAYFADLIQDADMLEHECRRILEAEAKP